MRLWHYKLLPYLPDKWITDQWRSNIAIKRNWEINGSKMNIPLINYIKDYDKDYFAWYTHKVFLVGRKRGLNFKEDYMQEIIDFCHYRLWQESLIYNEHNEEYLEICYFNLKEKYIRGIIPEEEWKILDNFYKEEIK